MHNKITTYCIFITFLFFCITACSSSDENDQKGTVEKASDKVAAEALEAIKVPIDKAKMAKELSEKHNQKIEEATKE